MTLDGHIHFFDIASQGKGTGVPGCFCVKVAQQTCMSIIPIRFAFSAPLYPGGLQTWSPNTIRVRMVLNYKGIKYTESFLAYPDIRPFCASFGIPDDKIAERPTLPVILHYDSAGKLVKALGNSFDIARYLEQLLPAKPVFGLQSGPYSAAAYAIHAALAPFRDVVCSDLIISKIPATLQPRCAEWFVEDRKKHHPRGLPPAEWPSKDPEDDWKPFEEGLRYLATLLGGSPTAPRAVGNNASDKGRPFLLGETPVYADFVVAGYFTWLRRASEDDFRRALSVTKETGELERHYQACEKWISAQGQVVEWDVHNKCIVAP
ncbi:hypothetical protein HDU86_005245 [Geranomyces michiganensis]|nr:hypothetical protein HDU86_005245 [Geranomyces michiganensis]